MYSQSEINPCNGRASGFARDLNSCNHFWACRNGAGVRGVCKNNDLFDGEKEFCLRPNEAQCFRCPASEPYQLFSVPKACHQYIRCFNGVPTLHACPSGLVFDGRTGIHNCNHRPANGICHRENSINGGHGGQNSQRCPSVGNKPVYLRDPSSCSV